MSWELWIAFVAASSALLAIPGPTVLIVVSYALGKGRQSAWATVPGLTLGDFTAMTVSLMGAGAVLAASAELFTVLKLAGAAYLIWLGIKLWRARPDPGVTTGAAIGGDGRQMFLNSFVVTALNPKSIVFFIAFVPQFIDPAAPVLWQFVILETTFLFLAAVEWRHLGRARRQNACAVPETRNTAACQSDRRVVLDRRGPSDRLRAPRRLRLRER